MSGTGLHVHPDMTPEEALSHYGIKGMRWGQRKTADISADTTAPAQTKVPMSNKKKVAIGLGVLVAAAGAGYAVHSLTKGGGLSVGSLKNLDVGKAGAKAAEKSLQPPTDIIHMARGKNRGMAFHRQGDTPDFFSVFDKLGMNEDGAGNNFFKRAEDGSGLIAARFVDPLGRSDFAGRPIAHDVVIPRSMTSGLNNLEDVKTKIWPQIQPTYDQFYQDSLVPKPKNFD